jgi:CubicO group peptidase (beta-lactamase class C family)
MSLKVQSICLKCSAVLIFLLLLQVSFAQYDFSGVDKKLQNATKHLGGSVSALIYQQDSAKIVYEKSIGKIDKRTVIPIASCSKWLTAALVMTFVDEGKISLDDYVAKYIPIFTTYKKGYITIRQCLSHQTGIEQKPFSMRGLLADRKFKSLEEEVNYYASKTEIDFNAGEGFYYGSVGLNIAARVCEIVSKKDFNRLMRDRILRPLQMRSTTFENENLDNAPNPSGGAKSTSEDYIHFLMMILNKGVYKDKRVLSEASINEMQTEQITLDKIKYAPKVAEGLTYGLGEWIVAKDDNGKSMVLASPGLLGSWPLIDKCRHYAIVFFAKTVISEEKRNIYDDILKSVNEVILNDNCK